MLKRLKSCIDSNHLAGVSCEIEGKELVIRIEWQDSFGTEWCNTYEVSSDGTNYWFDNEYESYIWESDSTVDTCEEIVSHYARLTDKEK